MKKIALLIIPILIIGSLSFIPHAGAEEKPWHLKASKIEIADTLENWLRKVIWNEKNSTELQLQALDIWIKIQPLTSDKNIEYVPIKSSGWTKMGGRSE